MAIDDQGGYVRDNTLHPQPKATVKGSENQFIKKLTNSGFPPTRKHNQRRHKHHTNRAHYDIRDVAQTAVHA
jgi:hypothetical protein